MHSHRSRVPSPWIVRHAGLIAEGGHVLDLACGGGRHTRYLRERGLRVTAIDIDTSPYHELRNYAQEHPEQRQQILDTLHYFDTMTLADAIECPILVNIGMADTTCPYDTIMPVFNRIKAHKSLLVYPDLTHSPCTDFNVHAMNWLKRYLGT